MFVELSVKTTSKIEVGLKDDSISGTIWAAVRACLTLEIVTLVVLDCAEQRKAKGNIRKNRARSMAANGAPDSLRFQEPFYK